MFVLFVPVVIVYVIAVEVIKSVVVIIGINASHLRPIYSGSQSQLHVVALNSPFSHDKIYGQAVKFWQMDP